MILSLHLPWLQVGLDVGGAVEVTNCFPLPTETDDDEADANGANYQL
jgi:hypothetical protein